MEILRYKHFEVIRELKPIPIITKFKNLQDVLMKPLPNQNKLSTKQMQTIFPTYPTDYESRIASIIENL